MYIILCSNLADFEIFNFFVSNSLTHSLTVTRPSGAFAPKNCFANISAMKPWIFVKFYMVVN